MASTTGWSPPPPTQRPVEEPEPRTRHRSFLAELPVLVLIAFVLALLLKTFLIQAFYIPSESMVPTLIRNDRVLVNKVVYRLREPQRGEIVVFSDEDGAVTEPAENLIVRLLRDFAAGLGMAQPGEKDFIKRIIGLPGETVEMRDGVVHIDGEPLSEAPTSSRGYLLERDPNNFGPVEVPEGHYFMMGDNRRNSSDSRFGLGTIPREHIVGRAFVVIWPLDRFRTLPIPDYDLAAPGQPAPLLSPAA